MSPGMPPVADRIADSLRTRSPRSAADLAREFLGLGVIDERIAARLVDPLLVADRRFVRSGSGWSLREPQAVIGSNDSSAALSPALAVIAPAQYPVAALSAVGGSTAPPAISVTLNGVSELLRAEQLLGVTLPRPTVGLARVVRRWRGYRGPADTLAIAEALRLPHVEADGAEAAAALLANVWERLAIELAAEGIERFDALEALLTAQLELPDLSGRGFGPETLSMLPNGPGVYIFRDRKRRCLYVGQSINLALRVGSYFHGPPRDEKDRAIRAESHTVEVDPAETIVDALLREARLIVRYAPRLNTRRAIHRAPPPDGIVVVPRIGTPTAAVAYVIAQGALRARVVLLSGGGRAVRPARRAAERLFEPTSGRNTDRDGAALIGTLLEQRRDLHFLQPAIDGGPAELTASLLAVARNLWESQAFTG